MVSDFAVKRFIVQHLLCNPRLSLCEAIKSAHRHLQYNFVLGEVALLNVSGFEAEIVELENGRYTIRVYTENGSCTKTVFFDEIRRRRDIKVKHVINFVDSVTKVSPQGRVFAQNALGSITETIPHRKDRRSFLLRTMMTTRSLEHYCDEKEDLRIHTTARRYSDLCTVIQHLGCEEVFVKRIDYMPLFAEVYVFLANFGSDLGLDLTFEEFALMLQDKKYSSDLALDVHARLLGAVKGKIRGMSTQETTRFFADAADICIEASNATGIPHHDKWRRRQVTIKNWKDVLMAFFAHICNNLNVPKVAYFENAFHSSSGTTKKLTALKFLIECVCSTVRLERLAKKRTKASNLPLPRFIHTAQDVVEKTRRVVKRYAEEAARMEEKSDIAYVDGMNFFCIGGNILFVRHNRLFRMDLHHVKVLLHSLRKRIGKYSVLTGFMKKYVEVCEKRLCDGLGPGK